MFCLSETCFSHFPVMNCKHGGKVSRTLELVVICRALYRCDLLTGIRFKQVEFEDNIRALASVKGNCP